MRNGSLLVATLFVVTSGAGFAGAQVRPTSGEFQVNTYTFGYQTQPSICHDAGGNFLVVWDSSDFMVQREIFAQRYDSAGNPIGTQFQINAYTEARQSFPDVCCSPDGDFVVAWSSYEQDGDNRGIFAQRFDSAAMPVGSEFQVNTYTPNDQSVPDICCDANEGFAVIWVSLGEDGGNRGVFGQRYDSNGDALGGQFQVNTYTVDEQEEVTLCCDTAGGFVAGWRSEGQDGFDRGVFAQRFDSSGGPFGGEFQVTTYTVRDQDDPDVCCGLDGGFVFTWGGRGPGDLDSGVFGQRFDDAGAMVGTEFLATTHTTGSQSNPSICCSAPETGFVITWQGERPDDDSGIAGRFFDGTGAAVGGQFPVSTYLPSSVLNPDVSCGPNDDFVPVWQSLEQDGNESGIFGRLFTKLAQQGTAAPAISWAGLALLIIGLLGGGFKVLSGRRNGSHE